MKKDDGSFDYDALGKIISEKEAAAAQAKEAEIAAGSTNPGGGSAGDNKDKEKSDAEKMAEGIGKTFAEANKTSESVLGKYL